MCEMGSCTQRSELTHETPSVCLKMQYLGINQRAHLIRPVRLFRHTQAHARPTSADLKSPACLSGWETAPSCCLPPSNDAFPLGGSDGNQLMQRELWRSTQEKKKKKGKSVSHHRQTLWPSSAVPSLDAQSLLLIAAHLFPKLSRVIRQNERS